MTVLASNGESSRAGLRRDVLCVAGLIAISILLFPDVFTGRRGFYLRDLTGIWYPVRYAVRGIVLSGEFPWWSRVLSGGQPVAANPLHAVFYPLNWLLLLPDYDLGFRLNLFVHLWIALAGMYALLRSLALGRPAAAFGAICWAFGGAMMSLVNLLSILHSAAWIAPVVLFARRYFLARRQRDLALASLCLAMQLLIGEPVTVIQTGLLLVICACGCAWSGRASVVKIGRNVAALAAAGLVALCAAGVQLLPGMDHAAASTRSIPFTYSMVAAWSMPWPKLFETLFPGLLGHVAFHGAKLYWASALYPGTRSPYIASVYAGQLVVILCAAGIALRRRGSAMLAAVLAISLPIALGDHTPLLAVLYRAGLARSLRFPEKFVIMAAFAVVVFAAAMFQRLVDGDARLARAAAIAAVIVLLVAGVATFFALQAKYADTFAKTWHLQRVFVTREMLAVARLDWLQSLLRAAIAAGVFCLPLRKRTWAAAAIAFTLLDLVPVAEEINPRLPSSFFLPPPVAQTLSPRHGDYRICQQCADEAPGQQRFLAGPGAYWAVRNSLSPFVNARAGIASVLEIDTSETNLLPTRHLTDAMSAVKRSGRRDWYAPFMAMSNAWYRPRYREFVAEAQRAGGDVTRRQPVDFVEGEHWPRYYFAERVVAIGGPEDFVRRAGADPPLTAYVPGVPLDAAPGVVQSVRETSSSALLRVVSSGRGFLVMSVTPHKYWRVEIDGRRVTPFVTNLGYQGVVVEQGTHTVSMRYRNPLVPIGAGLSLLAFGTIAAAALKQQRSTAPTALPHEA